MQTARSQNRQATLQNSHRHHRMLGSVVHSLRCGGAAALRRSAVRASALPASPAFVGTASRGIHASAATFVGQAFKDAEAAVKSLPSASNEQKLALYALYKQATVGPNTTAKPGMFDMVGKFKWQAWTELGSMSTADAEKKYIDTVKEMQAAAGVGGGSSPASGGAGASSAAAASGPTGGDILVSTSEGGVRTITFNRPAKRNAITFQMYHDVVAHLQAADADPAVRVVVLTGAGSFFCSGNDLSNFAAAATQGPAKIAADGEVTLKAYVKSFIHLAKPLIVGLNGPCVGIAMTTLPLADLVYASHKATLHAPLTALGQTPEGTASLTFPQVMGPARASELLLLGRKITAETAVSYGLVNEVWEDGEFAAKLQVRAAPWPWHSLSLASLAELCSRSTCCVCSLARYLPCSLAHAHYFSTASVPILPTPVCAGQGQGAGGAAPAGPAAGQEDHPGQAAGGAGRHQRGGVRPHQDSLAVRRVHERRHVFPQQGQVRRMGCD